jgi:hypothetical protein
LTLDDKKSDEFILKQNLDALRNTKNDEMTRITQDLVSIPATLVRLKWQNRREIYPLQVKEEIYGAVMNAIMEQRPELKEKLLGRLEANYQYLLAREIATLRLTRNCQTASTVPQTSPALRLMRTRWQPLYRTDGK